ncbi:MAG: mechanosensitive ion channel family protein [Nanoarchaeota archaeon]|nr:mechanosensitive ion channel family protein [Nanoarchaeota archaeon]
MLIKIFNNPWLDTTIIIILFLIGSKILTFIIEKIVKGFTRKTKTKLDDLLIEKLDKTFVWLLFFIGIRIFVVPLLEIDAIDMVNNAFIIFLITLIFVRIIDILIDSWGINFAKRTKSKVDESLLSLFHRFSRIVIFVIGGIIILNNFNIEVTPFLASLGIAGIVLAFALQSSLSNIFGGISLILDKNFKVGDTVKLGSGELGVILDIGLRSTKMKTFDNEMLVIPNGKLADSIIQNYAQPDLYARAVISFGVEYGSNIDKVRKVVVETLKKMPKVIKNDMEHPIEVLFINMGDFALQFEAKFWVKSYKERYLSKMEATEKIYNALRKSKVGIPFPTRTVYLKK